MVNKLNHHHLRLSTYLDLIFLCRFEKYHWNSILIRFLFLLFIPGSLSTPAENNKYMIFIATSPGNFAHLSGSMTLDQVNDKYWKVNKPLEMFYSLQKKSGQDANSCTLSSTSSGSLCQVSSQKKSGGEKWELM